MKKLTGKMRIFKYLLAAFLVVVLFTPEVAQAAELTVKSGSRKDYTATANGETIHVTLSGVTTNTQLMGKPSWITQSGSAAGYKLVVAKNTSTSSRIGDVVYRAGNNVYTIRITQKGQSKKSVTVKFNNNGGRGTINSKTYTIGKKYGSLPAGPTPPTGKKFAGWYTAKSGGTKITKNSKVTASTKTLYAHYTNKSYIVKFNSVGGNDIIASSVTYGAPYGALTTPVKTGYRFVGWYTAPTGGTKITSKTRMGIANNHTLYAHWVKKPLYTVTVKDGKKVLQTMKVYQDDPFYLPSSPKIPDGMDFIGWKVNFSDGISLMGYYKPHTKITVRENCVITAVFRASFSYIPDEDIYIPNNLLDK